MEKFEILDHKKPYSGMLCVTEEEAAVFSLYLDDCGRKWASGARYTDLSYGVKDRGITFLFNRGEYSRMALASRYEILQFADYDWSDYGVNNPTEPSMPVIGFDELFGAVDKTTI